MKVTKLLGMVFQEEVFEGLKAKYELL